MQRKPGFPAANCNIKMPDSSIVSDTDDDWEPQQRRQQLINFGHTQWTFNNWSWSVTKQELDFVELINGKYTAGVAAFVNVTVKSLDIHRENVGYATSVGVSKGSAIHRARKCAVTNALRETLLSFGGSVASDLLELLESAKPEITEQENNQNLPNKPEIKNARKEPESVRPAPPPAIKNVVLGPPVAKAQPMPANLPPAANRPLAANAVPPPRAPPPPPAPHPRANQNVSFVVPVMGGVVPPLYAPPPRLAPPPPPPVYPNYYEYGPWHFTYEAYERPHGNVNLNFNIPPKNLVVNSRAGSVECKNACRQGVGGPDMDPAHFAPAQNQGCWIKPTIFYDGFWTEQKVKKWVAEQVEKQFPDEGSKASSPETHKS